MYKNISLKYGSKKVKIELEKSKIKGIIRSNMDQNGSDYENKDKKTSAADQSTSEKMSADKDEVEAISKSFDKTIEDALNNPIAAPKLSSIVNKGESVTIIISDITRSWQNMAGFLPFLIEELKFGGIKLEDITILSAAGSHRNHTEAEKKELIGSYYGSITFIDHDAEAEDDMEYLGETSSGTPVYINSRAVNTDRLVLTGGIVFHNLAGYAGGRKSLLPGTAAYESIMKNHSLSLADKRGEGLKDSVDSRILDNNPVHLDMMEAAEMVDVDFILNVIPDGKGGISAAVAGDLTAAHQEGCKIIDQLFAVPIKEKAELVIASAGGYPKDMNLYQSSKALVNAVQAVETGGYLVLLADAEEGIGHPEVEDIIQNYNNNLEREDYLRRDFTISRYVGYLITKETESINTILVSGIEEQLLSSTDIRVVKSLQQALDILEREAGEVPEFYIMPDAANTLPVYL